MGQKPKEIFFKSVLKKGAKIYVFQFIWEVNGPKLSNLVNYDQNHAVKGQEWPKTVINRPKTHWKVAIVQIMPKKRPKLAKNDP